MNETLKVGMILALLLLGFLGYLIGTDSCGDLDDWNQVCEYQGE
jgi:hypothetical protein